MKKTDYMCVHLSPRIPFTRPIRFTRLHGFNQTRKSRSLRERQRRKGGTEGTLLLTCKIDGRRVDINQGLRRRFFITRYYGILLLPLQTCVRCVHYGAGFARGQRASKMIISTVVQETNASRETMQEGGEGHHRHRARSSHRLRHHHGRRWTAMDLPVQRNLQAT